MKRRLLLTLVTTPAITVSVAAYFRSTATPSPPEFVLSAVTRGDIVDVVEATGTLQAVTTVQVGTQVSGTIKTQVPVIDTRTVRWFDGSTVRRCEGARVRGCEGATVRGFDGERVPRCEGAKVRFDGSKVRFELAQHPGGSASRHPPYAARCP